MADHNAEIRPDSLYGVSKVYGEALGRYYHETYGMRVHNLRIGSVRADDNPVDPTVKDGSFSARFDTRAEVRPSPFHLAQPARLR
ncbi:MAG: NAD-dependent epimerase/dehydratase family protein [Thermomicrobiales bacterium]